MGDTRFTVKSSQQRTRGSKSYGEQGPGTQVDPKKVTCEGMADLFPLEHGLRKSIQSEIHKKEAEGSDHGHQPKVRWSQEPS